MLNLPYQKLRIWEKSMELTNEIYEMTKKFPKEELYGLVSQMRRSAVSIPSNIAEGSQRKSNADFAHFILIAKGSLAELETQVLLSNQQQYISDADTKSALTTIEEISKMLYSFHSKLITDHSPLATQ